MFTYQMKLMTPVSERACSNHLIPLYASSVRAGFPSPADDYIETHLDLNTHLIKHPAATFFVIAAGDSMTGASVRPGDMLIVDKSLPATHGKMVIAAINGELMVKRLCKEANRVQLLPVLAAILEERAGKNARAIDITSEHDVIIWGVITHVIHTVS